MNAPKVHHYVPQFYLRRFTNPDGCFWVWDKSTDKVFRTTPNSIAAESNFYKLRDFEKMGRDPLLMEKQFADLEGEVSLITDQWLGWLGQASHGDKIEIPIENRQIVALYITLQFLRTSDTKDTICAFHERSADLSIEDRTRLHTDVLWDLTLVRPFAKFIEESIWVFGRNRSGVPFFTSDNPVAFKTANPKMWLKVGFLSEGAYAVFPLSPDIVMYCKERTFWHKLAAFDNNLSPVDFTAAMVEHENSGQVFMAKRFVISPANDYRYAREFALSIGTNRYAPLGSPP